MAPSPCSQREGENNKYINLPFLFVFFLETLEIITVFFLSTEKKKKGEAEEQWPNPSSGSRQRNALLPLPYGNVVQDTAATGTCKASHQRNSNLGGSKGPLTGAQVIFNNLDF